MSSQIPEARRLLQFVLDNCEVDNRARHIIHRCIPMMIRDSYKPKKAKPEAQSMTPELMSAIQKYVAQNPEEQTKNVAEMFNVNPGRVSEALKRMYSH
jgi:hypothetical protein